MVFATVFLIIEMLIGALHGISEDALFIGECVFFTAIAICRIIEKR